MNKAKEPQGESNGELEMLVELMGEQMPNAIARAIADKGAKTSATWIGKGEHLVLLVVDASNSKKTKQTLYKCRILDLHVEESPR